MLTLDGTNKIVADNLNTEVTTLLTPKNWIINGGFDVWQRGTSQTSSSYGSDDRWLNSHATSTKTHSQQSFTIGQTDVPNNPTYFSRTEVTSGGTAGSLTDKFQRIEDVTKLAGKTVSLSFWAKANSSKNLSIEFRQRFGTSGSADVNGIGVQKFALTTSWQRFTKTFTFPSIGGKTIGAGSYVQFGFWFDAGSDYNSRTDSLGNQSGTFDIANVSLVEGSVPVEWQTEAYADVLRQCRRYCKAIIGNPGADGVGILGITSSSTACGFIIHLDTDMRIKPNGINYATSFISKDGGTTVSSAITSLTIGSNSTNSVIRLNAGYATYGSAGLPAMLVSNSVILEAEL